MSHKFKVDQNTTNHEIIIRKGPSAVGEKNITFIVKPIRKANENAYRALENPIQWSEDSQVATITTPDFTLSIRMKPDLENVGDGYLSEGNLNSNTT